MDCNTPQLSRDMFRRQGSSFSANTHAITNRNSTLNHSNGSLASECVSSNSASPAPSPSPTQYRQQHGIDIFFFFIVVWNLKEKPTNTISYSVQFSSLISDAGNGRVKVANSTTKTSFISTPNSLQAAKRWSSTSDFIPPPLNALASRWEFFRSEKANSTEDF